PGKCEASYSSPLRTHAAMMPAHCAGVRHRLCTEPGYWCNAPPYRGAYNAAQRTGRISSIRRVMAPFAPLMRGNLLLRFSLLSLVVLLGIGLGLGWILQQQMERTALVQQADEISVVIDSV